MVTASARADYENRQYEQEEADENEEYEAEELDFHDDQEERVESALSGAKQLNETLTSTIAKLQKAIR